MTVVTETLDLPGGANPRAVTVYVYLAGEGGDPLPAGYATVAGRTIVGQRQVALSSAGAWSLDLEPNGDITPAGTVWGVKLAARDPHSAVSSAPRFGLVPNAGPVVFKAILTDPPGALATPALTIETTARIAADAALRSAIDGVVSAARLSDDFAAIPSAGSLAPSGQPWQVAFAAPAAQANLVPHAGGGLDLSSAGASYMFVAGAHAPDEVAVEFSFGAGSTINAAVGVGVSNKTGPAATGVEGVASNSVHCSVWPTGWSIGIFNGVSLSVFASGAHALTVGQRYQFRIRRVGVDRVELLLPNGTSTTLRDGRIPMYWGKTPWFEHYQPSASFATDQRPTIYGFAAFGSQRRLGLPSDLAASACGLPGMSPFFVSALSVASGVTRYTPFRVDEPITITSAVSEITSAAGAGATMREAIVRADVDLQPLALVADLGTRPIDAVAVVTWSALSVDLDPGVYLLGHRASDAATHRNIGYLGAPGGLRAALGAAPFVQAYVVTEAYGAFSDPPSDWTSLSSAAATGFYCPVQLTWVPR